MGDRRTVSGNKRLMAGAAGARAARARRCVLAAGVSLTGVVLLAQGANAQDAQSQVTESESRRLVETYCVECHNFEEWAGGVAFDTMDLDHVGGDAEIWEEVVHKLRGGLMPPGGADQPDIAEVDAAIAYLETAIDAEAEHAHAGHVPIQRLNRTEFAASVKELIGVDLDAEQILPTEIEIEGFDNIADALAVSPSFLEQYVSAVQRAAALAVGESVAKMANTFYRAPGGSQTSYQAGFPLGTRGGMKFTHVFPTDGEYRFNILDVDAGLYPRGMETAATMVILVDGVEVSRVELGGTEDLALADRDGPEGRDAIIQKVSNLPAQIDAGAHEVVITFIERSWAASNNTTGNGQVSGMPRLINGIEIEGPFTATGVSMSESREKIFICQPESEADERPCAEEIARNLAARAFRRPVTDEDMATLMPFYEAGRAAEDRFDAGVRDMVSAILASPDFMYRAIQTAPEETRPLNDLELASRLSFFLWSQGPDDALMQVARDGELSDPAMMTAQVERMLDDPRASALIENFAFSWLNLDELEQVEPIDPAFNAAMRENFETEMRLFLSSVLLEDRSVTDLLNADYTFVNDALARQYDIPGVLGPQFRRVTLEDENRWGLLGKGAVLLRTSYGDRTSPVLRGAWVLDRIVGTPPTPPPPGVETDLSVQEGEAPTTIRARLEAHRADPSCNSCHGLIDPPGLALENFDVTGRWRDVDAAARAPIDATAELPNGVVLTGPVDLRNYLMHRPDQFPTTVTHRAMMYALNREIEHHDMPQIRDIVKASEAEGYTFESIITGIVNSHAFRHQGVETVAEASLQSDAAQTP